VLTTGSLLWMPEVRRDLAAADLVMPSLDAPDQPLFERVNRPHGKIPFDRMVDGLLEFAAGFQGRIWLEVFLLAGLTDAKDRVQRIAALARRIGPERVQLNTVSRPPADKEALAVPAGSMERLRKIFDKPAEIITESRPAPPGKGTAGDEDILALLRRRPCTVQGIAQGLGLHPNDVIKRLDVLVEAGLVAAVRREDGTYYESKKTG
jgi:wyosine [tRNA(Phe)-imidazoG37] synthetase (radical SAM superfamily)